MSVEKVKEYFKQYGIEDRIQEFEVSSATVVLASKALNCEPCRIAKTLSFMVNGAPILIVTAGDVKIDNGKYKAQFGAKAKMLNMSMEMMTMIIEAPLYYKATDLQSERCQVDEVVTLGHWQFEYLKNCTLDDFDFIEKLRDKLPVTNDNTRHCVMALDETGDDGILIDPQCYNYPRYSAYIPNAKQMLQMKQYPCLQAFNRDMMDTVEEVTQLAVNSQQDGEFHSDLSDIENGFQPNVLDKILLSDMLNDRPEFKSVEYADGELNAVIADEYCDEAIGEESGMSM